MNEINKNKLLNNALLNNVFLHEKYFNTFFDKNFREKRINDIHNLSIFYSKNNLIKISKEYNIISSKKEDWINAHKTKKDKEIATQLINPVTYISFETFYDNLILSTKKFNNYLTFNNIKKYYLIIGANNSWTSNLNIYLNIEKSNFWTILLIYPYLKIKPYDILPNLDQAIEFSIFDLLEKKEDSEKLNFVFVDDASYSGNQLFYNTIGSNLINKKYLNYIIKNNKSKNKMEYISLKKEEIKNPSPLQKINNTIKYINIHILVPYISNCAFQLGNEISLKNNINIYFYNNFIINSYEKFYERQNPEIIKNLENTYKKVGFQSNLIPLYFAHKMPDGASTISYILLSGIIINNSEINKTKIKKKYIQFIHNCIYPKNKNMNPKLLKEFDCNKLCPISPSKNIKNKIYSIMFNS